MSDSPTMENNAKDISENVTQPGTNNGNTLPGAAPAAGVPGTNGLPNPAADPAVGISKAVPGDVATRFVNRLINHFGDRNELTRIGQKEFQEFAVEAGLMHRTPYDPTRHTYLKDFADSRAIAEGGEVVAYTDEGERIMTAVVSDGPPAPDAGAAAAVGNNAPHHSGFNRNHPQRGRPRGR